MQFNTYRALGRFNRWQIDVIFSYFFQKIDFDISDKLSPSFGAIRRKCQSLFSGEKK